MKEIAAILSLLSMMFISTTVLANNEYKCKNVTCKDDISGSSDTVYSATGKLKAVFRRGSSSSGEMSVDYNFSSVNGIDIKLFELTYKLIRNLQTDAVTGDVYFK